MARKTAQTKEIRDADEGKAATEEDQVVIDAGTDQGGDPADEAAATPSLAPDADGPRRTGGEVGADLSAGASDEPTMIVTCHREGGRRRAGRRWQHGDTPVSEGELDGYQLALLRGDPQFTVATVAQD